MAQRLDAREASFPKAFAALLSAKREVSEDVDQAVRAIIEEVVVRGDEALIDYTLSLRRAGAPARDPAHLGRRDRCRRGAECPKEALEALALAKERIETYHRAQRPQDSHEHGLRWASPWAGAGRRSNPSASTFPAGGRAIPPPS